MPNGARDHYTDEELDAALRSGRADGVRECERVARKLARLEQAALDAFNGWRYGRDVAGPMQRLWAVLNSE